MDASVNEIFSADNLKEFAGSFESEGELFKSQSEYSWNDIEKYGNIARERIESAGMAVANVKDNPEEFAAALRRFWSVIREDKLFSCWIQCCCFKSFPDAVFDTDDSFNTKNRRIGTFKGRRISEILSAMSLCAFDDLYTKDLIKSFNPAYAGETGFAGYFYSCLERKAKEMFRDEWLDDKFHGQRIDNENQKKSISIY